MKKLILLLVFSLPQTAGACEVDSGRKNPNPKGVCEGWNKHLKELKQKKADLPWNATTEAQSLLETDIGIYQEKVDLCKSPSCGFLQDDES